jgi:hypothetical protein
MQSQDTIKAICQQWIASENVPQHLRAPSGKVFFFDLVWRYVSDHYESKFNFQNLNRALDRLTKSGRIPSRKGLIQNSQGLWVSPPDETKDRRKAERDALAYHGITKPRQPNHADEPQKDETIDQSMHRIAKQVFTPQAYNPPAKTETKLRNIPLDTPVSELKKYSAEEIRLYMQRKREAEYEAEYGR